MQTKLTKIQKQIDALEKQKQALTSKEKVSIIKDMNFKIGLYGITPAELDFSMSSRARTATPRLKANGTARKSLKGTKIPIKYKQGENTWTGRGRQPKWVAEHIAKGGKLEDLSVQ